MKLIDAEREAENRDAVILDIAHRKVLESLRGFGGEVEGLQ